MSIDGSTEPHSDIAVVDDQRVTLADAADLLGVHYMTAYRYVRTGRLLAVKEGGKWWVERSMLDAFSEAAAEPAAPGAGPRAQLLEPFTTRLIAGDTGGCWDLVTDALRSGASAAEVHEKLLTPALERVGSLWEGGELSIAAEHRATATANRLLGQMGPLFRHPGRRRGTLIIGTVAGDPHSLPSAMLGDLLADRNFNIVDLGANTPADSFIETATDADGLLGIGVCVVLDSLADQAVATVRDIRAALPDLALIIGGPVATRQAERFTPYVSAVTETASEACAFFDAVREGSS